MMRFEEQYFKDTGKKISNYQDYTQKKFDLLADDLIDICQLSKHDRIIDYGCATGLLMKCLMRRGFRNIVGTDISYWAVEFGRNELRLGQHIQHHNLNLLDQKRKDVVFFLDVLEHIPTLDEIHWLIHLASKGCRKCLIIRLPVSDKEGQDFVLEVSRNDKTHLQCHEKSIWLKILEASLHWDHLIEYLKGKAIYDSEGVLAIKVSPKIC